MALQFPSENIQLGMQMAEGGNPTAEALRSVVQRYKDLRTARETQAGEMDLYKRKSDMEFEGFKKQEEYKAGQKATETESMRQFELKKMGLEQSFKREESSAKRMGGLRDIKYKAKLKGLSGEDLTLWKQAEDEVLTKLGGSAMMGLQRNSEQYYDQIEERYNQLKSRFGGGPTTPITQPTDGSIEETNW